MSAPLPLNHLIQFIYMDGTIRIAVDFGGISTLKADELITLVGSLELTKLRVYELCASAYDPED